MLFCQLINISLMVARRHERESTRYYNKLKGPKTIVTVGIEKVFEMDLALNGETPAVTSVSLVFPFHQTRDVSARYA